MEDIIEYIEELESELEYLKNEEFTARWKSDYILEASIQGKIEVIENVIDRLSGVNK